MNIYAIIDPNHIAVTPIERPDDGSLWLQIDIPNGWDDVKKICKRVLTFQGRTYKFMSWNSDTMKCHFKATTDVALVS
jgi:hypothetical protein